MSVVNWRTTARNLIGKSHWVLGYTTEDFPGDTRSLNTIQQHGFLIDAYASSYCLFSRCLA